MIKKIIPLLSLILFIMACNPREDSSSLTQTTEDVPLSKFVIGEWYGEDGFSGAYGIYIDRYRITFINNDTLEYSGTSLYDGFKDKYTYHFINDNKIALDSDRSKGDMWDIVREGKQLIICIGSSQKNCIVFTRATD